MNIIVNNKQQYMTRDGWENLTHFHISKAAPFTEGERQGITLPKDQHWVAVGKVVNG